MTKQPRTEAVDDPADFPNDTSDQSVDKLIAQGTQMVEAVDQLRTSVDRQRRAQICAVAVFGLLVLVLAFVALDNHGEISILKRQMCGAVVGIVPAPGDAPPPAGPDGDRSRDVIDRFRILAGDFECELRR